MHAIPIIAAICAMNKPMNDFAAHLPFANKRWDPVPLYRWCWPNIPATSEAGL
jgi:hypothetical protein